MQSYPKTRLFVESKLEQGTVLMLEGDTAHYLLRVMRCELDDRVALFNGVDGEWVAVISDMQKKHVTVEVKAQLRPFHAVPDVWMCFAPIKFGRIDFLVEKATELGASVLQPVMTQYTQSERVNLKRLRAHIVEAAEQSGRMDMPQLADPIDLPTLLATWDTTRVLCFGDEGGGGINPKEWMPKQKLSSWGVLVGPEGGFSPQERKLLYDMPFCKGINLGPRILRSDTAALTLLSITQGWFGDWHIKPQDGMGDNASYAHAS